MRGHHETSEGPAHAGRRAGRERDARERRALRTGLAISVVAHLLVIGVVGDWLAPHPGRRTAGRAPVVVEPAPGMRAVDLVVVATPAIEAPSVPTSTEEERRPPRVVTARPTVPSARRPADDRTAADRLAPRVVDPRLWEPMVLIPREPTLSDVQDRVAAAVELLSDSALAEADRAMRARDWTVTDADGGKWGISPGKLHLGKLTLPLPIYFAEEWDPRQAEWYDLEAQMDRAMVLESFEARVKAIRERRDRERRERTKADDGG